MEGTQESHVHVIINFTFILDYHLGGGGECYVPIVTGMGPTYGPVWFRDYVWTRACAVKSAACVRNCGGKAVSPVSHNN